MSPNEEKVIKLEDFSLIEVGQWGGYKIYSPFDINELIKENDKQIKVEENGTE